MYFSAEVTPKTVLFLAVFTPWAITFVGAAAGAKTRSSETRAARAAEGVEVPKTVIRADSFSDSKEKEDKVEDESLSKADSRSSGDNDDDASGPKREVVNIRSTKGIRPGEYEPDDDGRVHGRYQEDEEQSDDDARRYRYKREAKSKNYGPSKRKGKKEKRSAALESKFQASKK